MALRQITIGLQPGLPGIVRMAVHYRSFDRHPDEGHPLRHSPET